MFFNGTLFDIVKILVLYIMAQNTKHRRNKKNKSVKKQKVRGGKNYKSRVGSTSSDESTRSNARSTARKSSVYKVSKPVPKTEIEKQLKKMIIKKYDKEGDAIFQAGLIIKFIEDNFVELNKKESWFIFTFQPQGRSFFLPKVIELSKINFEIIITNHRYNF